MQKLLKNNYYHEVNGNRKQSEIESKRRRIIMDYKTAGVDIEAGYKSVETDVEQR